ncbi:helix-turn-helix transcriptional regulator [Rhizobium sp. KVB221]|uniref:Helix-turn-helix transcriptional regulator n=1 Tax=Rhizobium setariae TaxID=2801340 RepID=A0A937CP77_9HYPH|nr:helix-turn-helix transcriptional regulator [Rhizobium setariae]MBL0374601.1 helix-turn-helix transcriptional regulator [Rhizobium setariae]
MTDTAQTIDRIYEAAFVPENWYSVLDRMARSIDAEGTLLFCATDSTSRSLVSDGIVDLVDKFNEQKWSSRNIRAARLFAACHEGFLNDGDLFTQDEMSEEPMYKDFLRPNGFGFGAATAIQLPSGDRLIFSIEKKKVKGPVDRGSIDYLDQLRPHLARAALMSSRLEFERMNAAIEALQLTGLPSAVLGFDGKVLASNQLFENFSQQVAIGARDQIRCVHSAGNALLANAISRAQANPMQMAHASHSFPLPQHQNAAPAIVHLVPVRGSARDIFVRAAYFLIVTPVDRSRVPSAEVIQGLFDLSPAEARVARSIAAGSDVSATANRLSLSAETVRSHVKAILSKSGMSRQADFVAAIASIRPVGE